MNHFVSSLTRFRCIIVTARAFALTALMLSPVSVLAGSDSFLFVADYDKHKVLRYETATGAFVDEFVPKHSGGLNQPQFLVIGPHDHDLYVGSGHFAAAQQHRAVLRYDGETGTFLDEFAEGGHLTSTHGVIFGPDGHLYVGDIVGSYARGFEGRIIRFDGRTGAFLDEFVPANSGGLKHPFGIVFGPSGNNRSKLDLFVANGPGDILRYDGTTGEFLGTFVPCGTGGLDLPLGLTFGPDGNLYVTNSGFRGGPDAVLRFQGPTGKTPGAFIDAIVPPGSGGLASPFAVVFGPDGNGDGRQDLYVSSTVPTGGGADKGKNGTVKRYDGISGNFIDTFISSRVGGIDNPTGLAFTETDPVTLQYLGSPHVAAIQLVPEPASALLLALAMAALLAIACNNRMAKNRC